MSRRRNAAKEEPTVPAGAASEQATYHAVRAEPEPRLDPKDQLSHLRAAFERELETPAGGTAEDSRSGLKHILRGLYARWLPAADRALGPARLEAILTWTVPDKATLRKVLKTAVALAIAVFVGWGPVQRLMQTTSVEAVVNARLITLRAPIDGEVAAAPGALSVGAALAPGASLMSITNRRADRARLDDLRRSMGRLEDERAVLEVKLQSARGLHAEFVAQTRQFQGGRVRQLEARAAEIRSELAAAHARREETAAALQRTVALESRGAQTRAALDRAQRDNEIAVQTIAAGEQRLRALDVELQAARSGYFLGDSYNDRPRSAQRADELQQQIVELDAELKQRDIRLKRLTAEFAEETSRFNDLAQAEITAPSRGSVWEVLTAPGEAVGRGQELVRMLDCSSAMVTATVAESVYNRLRVGQPARFRFREGGAELQGRVVHLTGMAAAPANFAITPSALIREAYRVTVAIPALTQSPTCDLGRTGRVVFEDAPGTAAAAPASTK